MIAREVATAWAASSSTIESMPPESATATRAPSTTLAASNAAIAAATMDWTSPGVRARSRPRRIGRIATDTSSCTAPGAPSPGREFLELAIAQQLVFARFEQLVERLFLRLTQSLGEGLLQRDHHGGMITVGAAERLVDDLVDEPEGLEARRGDAQRFRRLFGMRCRLPENRSAPLGRDHRVGGVLQHQRGVADGNVQRAAGTSLTDHRDDDRRAQASHFVEIAANGLRLAALLGADTGERARR